MYICAEKGVKNTRFFRFFCVCARIQGGDTCQNVRL